MARLQIGHHGAGALSWRALHLQIRQQVRVTVAQLLHDHIDGPMRAIAEKQAGKPIICAGASVAIKMYAIR